jgi:hypothetical protein
VTHANQVPTDGQKCTMDPRECSQSLSKMRARGGIGRSELMRLDEANCTMGIGLGTKGGWIKKRCEHA